MSLLPPTEYIHYSPPYSDSMNNPAEFPSPDKFNISSLRLIEIQWSCESRTSLRNRQIAHSGENLPGKEWESASGTEQVWETSDQILGWPIRGIINASPPAHAIRGNYAFPGGPQRRDVLSRVFVSDLLDCRGQQVIDQDNPLITVTGCRYTLHRMHPFADLDCCLASGEDSESKMLWSRPSGSSLLENCCRIPSGNWDTPEVPPLHLASVCEIERWQR